MYEEGAWAASGAWWDGRSRRRRSRAGTQRCRPARRRRGWRCGRARPRRSTRSRSWATRRRRHSGSWCRRHGLGRCRHGGFRGGCGGCAGRGRLGSDRRSGGRSTGRWRAGRGFARRLAGLREGLALAGLPRPVSAREAMTRPLCTRANAIRACATRTVLRMEWHPQALRSRVGRDWGLLCARKRANAIVIPSGSTGRRVPPALDDLLRGHKRQLGQLVGGEVGGLGGVVAGLELAA